MRERGFDEMVGYIVNAIPAQELDICIEPSQAKLATILEIYRDYRDTENACQILDDIYSNQDYREKLYELYGYALPSKSTIEYDAVVRDLYQQKISDPLLKNSFFVIDIVGAEQHGFESLEQWCDSGFDFVRWCSQTLKVQIEPSTEEQLYHLGKCMIKWNVLIDQHNRHYVVARCYGYQEKPIRIPIAKDKESICLLLARMTDVRQPFANILSLSHIASS